MVLEIRRCAWALREIRDKKLYRESIHHLRFLLQTVWIEPTLVDLAMEVTEFEFVRAARKAAREDERISSENA